MKKILLLLVAVLALGTASLLKAQCYGSVRFDTMANAGAVGFPLAGNTTFTITTTHCHDLIMISYNGWNGPGSGPVTVNGNPATYIQNATNGNSGTADVYAYEAGPAGSYTIICSPNGYNTGYYNNFAAAFYATGTGNPLTIASLTNTIATIVCTTGGSITDNITTSIPNSAIYCSAEINEGQTTTYPISWTGATFLGNTHTEDGIDAGHAYTLAPTAGIYTVTATNSSPPANGCGGLTIVLVDIPPPLCGGAGGSLKVTPTNSNPTCGLCNGSITVSVAGGTPPYVYTWTPNVSNAASANNLCAGTYSINVTDASCNDTTIVDSLPKSGIPLRLADTLTTNEKCFGDCTANTTIAVSGGKAPYAYSWAPNGGNAASANNLCAGVYTVTVTDSKGCTATVTATITQPAPLAIAAAINNVLCNGGTGSITAIPTGGTSPYTYSWTLGGHKYDTANNLTIGTYSVKVTDNRGCIDTTSAIVTQPPVLSVTLSGPALICNHDSGTLIATPAGGTAPYKYTWIGATLATPNDSSARAGAAEQTDTVTVTDAHGCTASAQIVIHLGPPINLSITGPPSICQTLSTTLCADVQGGTGGNSYTWLPGNGITPCFTVSPSSTTMYSLTVMDNCGTTASTTYTLRVNPLPLTAFTSSLNQGCAPLCVQFYNTTTLAQGNAAVYTWSFGNGDSSITQNPIYCYPSSGTYDVSLMVISDSGCSSTLSKTRFVTAFANPNGAFTYTPNPLTILTPTVQFGNLTTDPYNIIYWQWNFGDATDSMSNLANPSHTYQDTGKYCVNMIAEDEHGCTDTVTNCLVIEPDFHLYIPSAFTPNGDSKNPTFEPKGQYIKSFEMYIFDRWGMQLFHTTNINTGWDGTVQGGSVAQEDTYVYKIIVTDPENKQHTYVGNVTLLK